MGADVEYQLAAGGPAGRGNGRTVNISSRGVLLQTETVLPAGASIALQVAWPVKLERQIALSLHIRGYTLRSDGDFTAIRIERHEFRIRRQITNGGEGAPDRSQQR